MKTTETQAIIANPTPWEIFGDEIRGYGIRDARKRIIVGEFTLPKITAELIAAAPELLETLNEMVRVYEAKWSDEPTALASARAAIAKATGGAR